MKTLLITLVVIMVVLVVVFIVYKYRIWINATTVEAIFEKVNSSKDMVYLLRRRA